MAALEATIKWVQGESFLGSDGASLVASMNADVSGLEALGSDIAAATSVSQAQTEAGDIFSEFRVYDLVLPVAHGVSTVDLIDNVRLPDLAKDIAYLQSKQGPKDQAALAPLIANMQLQVQTATNATSGVAAELLGYTAAEWDANSHLLSGADSNIYLAERAVAAAQKDDAKAEAYLHWLDRRHKH